MEINIGDRIAVRCSLTHELHVGRVSNMEEPTFAGNKVYRINVDCDGNPYYLIENNDTIYPVRKLRGNKIV